MKDFWNDLITQRSWEILLELKKQPFKFVVIGGWAAYLWTKTHKSKDIDIVLKSFDDLNYLKQNYDLKKNDHLSKYEIKIDEIDIDIYVAHYSKLAMPAEEILKHTTKIEGIEVVAPEALLILKQGAETDRRDSVKGIKDRIDIMTLLTRTTVDLGKYRQIAESCGLQQYPDRLKQIIKSFTQTEYLGMTPRELKLKKKELMEKLKQR